MPAATDKAFRDSAVIVLIRGSGRDLETYWVRRSDAVPVQPGFYAFVGGKVDAQDAELPLEGMAADDIERAARACAIREALEETGVLVAAKDNVDAATLAAARGQLLAGEARFPDLVAKHGWQLDPSALVFAGRWQTPPFAPARFDTLYFLARVPAGQEPTIVPGELAHGEWIKPMEAIECYRRGEVTFVAPILWTLMALAGGEERLAQRLVHGPERAGRPVRRIEMQWGVVLHPMRTKPLPPAQHTNAYFIGEREMALVDPGSGDSDDLRELFTLAEELTKEGRRVTMIVVTHHHPDHVGGVEACRAYFGAKVVGHGKLVEHMRIDVAVKDGDWLPLTPGINDWTTQVLATPGHTRDSISLWLPKRRALFCGDLMQGGPGTVVIDPPDGDMGAYLQSLERCAALEPVTMFPAHGSPSGAAAHKLRALIAHRRERERKVLAALDATPRALADLVPMVYADTPRELWPLAERSLLAHLLDLQRTGRASREGDRWRVAGG